MFQFNPPTFEHRLEGLLRNSPGAKTSCSQWELLSGHFPTDSNKNLRSWRFLLIYLEATYSYFWLNLSLTLRRNSSGWFGEFDAQFLGKLRVSKTHLWPPSCISRSLVQFSVSLNKTLTLHEKFLEFCRRQADVFSKVPLIPSMVDFSIRIYNKPVHKRQSI